MFWYIRTASIAAATVLAGAALNPGIGLADSPHFIYATGAIDTTTADYTASFKEAGLGNTPVTYNLSATTQFTYQCFTKSGNKPRGAPNSGGPSSESTQTTITPRNGQITGTLTLGPVIPPSDVSCQGNGLKLCLTAASYTNVQLVDVTNNVAAALPSGSVSAPSGSYIACSP